MAKQTQNANEALITQFLTENTEPPIDQITADNQVEGFNQEQGAPVAATPVQKAADKGNTAAQALQDAKLREADARARIAEARASQAETTPENQPVAVVQPPDTLTQLRDDLGDNAKHLTDWVAALPTPGGVMALIFALLFFIWIIVPVNGNGDTRLFLLWKVLTGQSQIDPALGAGFSSGNWGTPITETTYSTPAPLSGVSPVPTAPTGNKPVSLGFQGGAFIPSVVLPDDYFGKSF